MLIMESTDVNFAALADNIANEFFSKGTPLSDGCVKTAKDNSLTPEEVRRLVEATNRAASLHLLKTADDKKATFTLAQTGLVLSLTHPGEEKEESSEKTASVYEGLRIPARCPERDHFADAVRAQCAVSAAFGQAMSKTAAQDGPSEADALREVFALRRALDERRQEKLAHEACVQDLIDYLASEFSVWNGPDFGKFASECRAVFGRAARPVLSGLSRYLGAPMPHAKTAAAVVDDTTPHMVAMREICSGIRGILRKTAEIAELEAALDHAWGGAKTAAVSLAKTPPINGGAFYPGTTQAAYYANQAAASAAGAAKPSLAVRGVQAVGRFMQNNPRASIGIGAGIYGLSRLNTVYDRFANNINPAMQWQQ